MARYCFYCGVQLATGERCSCRTKNGSAYNPDFHQQHTTEESAPETPPPSEKKAEKNPFRRFQNAGHAGGSTKKNYRKPKSEKSFDPINVRNIFRRLLKFMHKFFTRPTEVIRDAQSASLRSMIVVGLLEAIAFGLMILTFVRFSNITRMVFVDLSTEAFRRQLFLSMSRGFVAAIVLTIMRVLISMVVLRFVGQQNLSCSRLWRAFLPGTYYEILIMFVAIFFVAGTGLQAIAMLLCAISARTMIDTLSLKEIVSLSMDRLLLQGLVIHVVVYLLLAAILNFSVPSLANFGVIPRTNGDTDDDFVPNAYAAPAEEHQGEFTLI